MQTETSITSIIAMSRRKASRKKLSHRSRKESRYISKYNNIMKRVKNLKATATGHVMTGQDSYVKQLKQGKLSPTERKAFQKPRKAVCQLVNSRTSMSKRRTILCQCERGAFYDLFTSIPFLDQVIKYVDSL